jgi:hypothetical protein
VSAAWPSAGSPGGADGIEFTPEQEAAIRARLGFGEHDREVTAADLIVVLTAREIVLAAEKAWLDGEEGL